MGDDAGAIEKLLATLAAASDAFDRSGDHIKEAGARFELGRYLFQLGRGDASFAELCRAAGLFHKEGAPLLAAQALLGCAHALTIQNLHEKSLEWFDRSIDQFERCQDIAGEMEASAGRLEALADLKRWDETERSRKIIAATEHNSDPRLRVFRLVALRYQVQARLADRDLNGALGPAQQAADLAGELGDQSTEANHRMALAHNLRMLKQYTRAAEEYERVAALAHGVPDAADLEEQALECLGAVLHA